MNAFQRFLGARDVEAKSIDATALIEQRLLGLAGGSKAGVSVSTQTALRVPTVLACARVLAEGVAQVPWRLMREDEDGRKQVVKPKDHPVAKVFRRPNDWQTSFEFRETGMLHAMLAKAAISLIVRGSTGKVLELLPLLPEQVQIEQDDKWNVTFRVTDGKANTIAVQPRSAFYVVRGPSWNGFSAMEMVRQAREAIGLSIAAEETLARLHSNGIRPSGLLSTDNKLTKEQIDRIKASFSAGYEGVANAFKTIVLDGGLKFTQMSLSPADTQTNESRKHQIEEICRVLRVFPQMIGYSDKTATYASAEQFFIAHVVHSLTPWLERWEQAAERDLLTPAEVDDGYFTHLDARGLLRGDAQSRANYIKAGINDGWLTRNEARRHEDLDPIEGLDEPLVPLNMRGINSPDPSAGDKLALPPADASPDVQQKFARALALSMGAPHLEAKIGRVLSARNEGKLKQARDLLDEVIAQVDAVDAS